MGFFVSAQQERAFSRMGLGLNAPSALSVVVNAQADALDMRWSSGLIAG
ncbi:hypothetical protein [Citrobacter freundii]|nr:hypothetical protein [Citrobacter freundii]MDE9603722.1 hypothetical protein [Citrobacter freundii]